MRVIYSCLVLLAALSACATSPDAPAERVESIVFVSERSGAGDIYALNLDDLSVSPLITSSAAEPDPMYDAARNRIVYRVVRDDGVALYADNERLMADPSGDGKLSWSPDGRYLVFSASRDGNDNLYLAAVDGSSERRLTDGRFSDRDPVFAPDGRSIAFVRELAGTWDIHRIDLETRRVTPLTAQGRYLVDLAFSPDGGRLVFSRHYGDQADIAMLTLATGEIERLTDRPGDESGPVFSLDGTRVLFAAEHDDGTGRDLWQLDLATGEALRLTDRTGFDGSGLFVPESAWVDLLRPAPPDGYILIPD